MDFETIQRKLHSGAYHAIKEYEADVHLTFDNAWGCRLGHGKRIKDEV